MQDLQFQHKGQHQQIGEGIFFGMPEDLYHAIPALSSTAFKNLLTSAPDFYFNSWLNPLRDEDAEDEDAKEWQRFGKASHSRILEGRDVFDTRYCVEFIAPDGCLDTKADLQKFCDDNGVTTKKSWKKEEFVNAIRTAGLNPLIYDVEAAKYAQATGGKQQLTEKEIRRIEIAAAMVELHPELRHFFRGGFAEVTVVWQENGIWFKARFDYLKPRAIIDLKTFTNKRNKPIDLALHETMGGLKYHIQAWHYDKGARKAAEFASKNMVTTYTRSGTEKLGEFLKALAESDGHEFYFVFQKKGGAPLARGKRFRAQLSMWKCAEASINDAIELYKQYSEEFGTGIWVDKTPVTDFEDALFPTYATEI